MNPHRPHRQTAVPKVLEVRLEIANAIRTLPAEAADDELLRRRAEIIALRRDLEHLAEALRQVSRECEPRLRSYVLKYSPDQPRVPGGNPDGGQWTKADQSGAPSNSTAGSGALVSPKPVQFAALDTGTRTDAINAPAGMQYAGGIEDDENENRIGGLRFEGSESQLTRQEAALDQWRAVYSQVQKYDPTWKPSPVWVDPNSIEGDITKLNAWTEEARDYLGQLLDLARARDRNTEDLVSPTVTKTGNPFIDFTTEKLLDILDDVVKRIGPRPDLDRGQYGTLVHVEFAKAVRAAGLHGIDPEDVERTFGVDNNASYGAKGSVRPDAVLCDDSGKVIAIYDVKTGAGFEKTQIIKYRLRTKSNSYVPLFELRPGHRAIWKAKVFVRARPR